MKRFAVCAFSGTALAFCAAAAFGEYPDKPVRIVVPFEPGGGVDIAARTVQPGLTEGLRQTVVIENRSGAGGIIGAAAVAKAAPDGYMLLMGSSSTLTVAPNLYKNIPYNPLRDFAPISGVETKPYILVVHPVLPVRNVKELVTLAKKNVLTMSSAGTGSSNHLTGELFQMLTGVRFTHVPYKGGAPAALALIGGQVDLQFDQITSSIGHVRQGRLRALTVTSYKRSPELPDVPTIREAGVPGGEASGYTALLAPAGTPTSILSKLNAVLVKVLESQAVREHFRTLGTEASPGTVADVTRVISDDLQKWAKVVAKGNVKVE